MADHAAPRRGARLRVWDYTEPARLRAVATAVVALAGALGLTLPFDLPGVVEALIPVLAFVLPLVQGEATRRAVYSPATRNADLGRAAANLRNGPRD